MIGTADAIDIQVDEHAESQNHIIEEVDIHDVPHDRALRRLLKGMRSTMDEIDYQNFRNDLIEHLWRKRRQSSISEQRMNK